MWGMARTYMIALRDWQFRKNTLKRIPACETLDCKNPHKGRGKTVPLLGIFTEKTEKSLENIL